MNEQDFIDSVRAAKPMLFRLAYSILRNVEDCADALQDALEHAWRKLPTLKNANAFRGWMARIVINCSHNILRKRKLRTMPLDDSLPAPEVTDSGLADALALLDERYRLPLVLHYMEGMPITEVAAVLHLPQGTVKNRLFRARKQLADLIKKEETEWN